jgi:uncharacterized protein (TIGR03663 family)
MRLWDLSMRAAHHDESIHGFYAFQVYQGNGYDHNPLTHGMFLFHILAGTFFLFGDNDFTLRVPMAIFGAALVAVPLLLRPRMGQAGALAAAVLLAFSPALLYFSRFARNDIFVAVFTLALVGVMFRYMDSRRNRWLYAAAALIAFGFTTKETQYIVVALLGGYLAWQTKREWWEWLMGRMPAKEFSPSAGFLLVLGGLSLPMFAATIGLFQSPLPFTLIADNNTPGLATGAPSAGWGYGVATTTIVLLILAGWALGLLWKPKVWAISWVVFAAVFSVFYTNFFTHPGGIGTGIWQSLGYWLEQHDVRRGDQPWYYYFMVMSAYEFLPFFFGIGTAAFMAVKSSTSVKMLLLGAAAMFSVGGYIGFSSMNTESNFALRLFLVLAGLSILLLLAGFWVMPGLKKETTAAQVVQRLQKLGLYEAVREGKFVAPLLISAIAFAAAALIVSDAGESIARQGAMVFHVAGIVLLALFALSVRTNDFRRFLLFWSVVTLAAYSLAGEKMPWLLTHVTLPFIMMAAMSIGDILMHVPWRLAVRRGVLYLAAGVPLFLLLVWRLTQVNIEGTPFSFLSLFLLLATLGILLVAQHWLGSRIGHGAAWGSASLVLAVLMLGFAFRAGWIASYVNGDVPKEILVYTQTAPDIRQVAEEIELAGYLTGDREEIRLSIDSSDGFAWPWHWYLRHNTRASYTELSGELAAAERGVAVAIINQRNNNKAALDYQVGYTEGRRIVHRWWFPENYRQLTPKKFFETVIDRDKWGSSVDFFLYRELANPIGSVDSYVYFSSEIPLTVLE